MKKIFIKNKLSGILFLFLTSILLLSSCQEDDVTFNTESQEIILTKSLSNQFENLHDIQLPFFNDNLDWNNSTIINNQVFIPIKNFNSSTFKKSINKKNDISKNYSYSIFDLTDNKRLLKFKIYIENSKIRISNVEELLKLIKLYSYQDNQPSVGKKNQISYKSDEGPEPACETYGVYEHAYDPNTGETDTTLLYTFDVCNGTWYPEDDPGGTGTSGGSGNSSNLTIDDKIDPDKLDSCSKAILEALQEKKSIEEIINQFAGEDADFNWTLETINNPIDAATTTWDADITTNIITRIDIDYKNSATTLALARTIIHEAIHAYIISYINIADTDPELSSNKFPRLWLDLLNKRFGNPIDSGYDYNPYQHEEMARNYIDTISSALASWDNNSKNSQYYIDLAWGGLFGTEIYQNTTALTDNDRTRIESNNLAEDTSSSSSLGNLCN